MSEVARLMRWEWFKLQRRWMPWILLGVLLLFTQLTVWGPFIAYQLQKDDGGSVSIGSPGGPPTRVPCDALFRGDPSTLPAGTDPQIVAGLRAQCQAQATDGASNLRAEFALPQSLNSALRLFQQISLVLLAILTSSTIGIDYGTGTLRTILGQGVSRLRYLAGKFGLLVVLAAAALIVVALVTMASSLIADSIAGGMAAARDARWSDVAVNFVKVGYSLLPYMAIVAFATVLFRSSAAGMGLALGYLFAEQILVAIFSALFDWFNNIAKLLPLQNVVALAPRGGLDQPDDGSGISTIRAVITLSVYLAAAVATTVWIFRRRDVTSATSG